MSGAAQAETTLAIVKPDAFERGLAGRILAHLEEEGFRLLGARLVRLGKPAAERFYAVHRGKPFFTSLVDFMTSGPCMALALRRPDAVAHLRRVIGATDPAEAEEGTIRALFAESKERNVIHASDSARTAVEEVAFFFGHLDLVG